MANNSKYNISSRHFKDLVLLSLDKLSTEGKAIYWIEVQQDILSTLSLKKESFGFPKGKQSGKTNLEKWIYKTFNILESEGLIEKTRKRGHWLLTFKGARRVAVELRDITIDYTLFQPPKEETPGEISENLSFILLWPKNQEITPLEPYIEELLMKDASCFGYFRDSSEECSSCPLKVHCADQLKNHLKNLEVKLNHELSLYRHQKTIPASIEAEILDKSKEENKIYPTREPLLKGQCRICNQQITDLDSVTWKRNYGEVHSRCVKK